jgi:osmotically-inducible protein OsmY
MPHDSSLQQTVLDELSWEPSLIAGHIGVAADDGVVTLTGHVENYSSKWAAENAARRVKGVKAVAEEIEVRLPFESRRDDGDIASAAINRLAWDVAVPRDAIKVKVEKGWVTLTGEVDWHFQKEAAEHDIRPLYGVVGLSNQTTIKPKVDTQHIGRDITHALHRSWADPRTVRVSAAGGKVHLTGTVHSAHDRTVAGQTAWSAPGATFVENDISIV